MTGPKFCSECGTQFLPDAVFCHKCGAPVGGGASRLEPSTPMSPLMRWGVPALAILALIIVVFFRVGSRTETPTATASAPSAPMATGSGAPPDISSMSPEERADRLFNRVMTYASNGKNDSAAFFAPMAMTAIESLAPLGAHGRYDLGLVALVAGDAAKAGDTPLLPSPRKLEAIRCFASQFEGDMSEITELYPAWGRLVDRVTTQCKYFGHLIGVDFAEPFVVKELMAVDDVVAMPVASI